VWTNAARVKLSEYLALICGHRRIQNLSDLVLFLSKSFSTSAKGKAAQEGEQQNMNWDQVVGEWKEVKGKAREKWGKLTDDDLHVIAGKREQLVGRLQERYGWAREEAEREADAFVAGYKEGAKTARTAR
jgi:uncharacterized protein YjbJ (UPF0337 family)